MKSSLKRNLIWIALKEEWAAGPFWKLLLKIWMDTIEISQWRLNCKNHEAENTSGTGSIQSTD